MPAHDDNRLASGPTHGLRCDVADAAARGGSPAGELPGHRRARTLGRALSLGCRGLGGLLGLGGPSLDAFLRPRRRGRGPAAQFSGLLGHSVPGRAGLAAQVVLDVRSAVLCAPLHVGLRGQGLDRPAELLPGLLDLFGERLFLWRAAVRGVLAHRCALSLICSTSAFTLSAARLGTGGVAFVSWPFPASAAMPAAANSATPTISAASHGRITPPRAMIAPASRHPVPYKAMTPPPPNRPAPRAAVLALPVISTVASFTSSRTSCEISSDSCLTSWPVDASGSAPEDAWLPTTVIPVFLPVVGRGPREVTACRLCGEPPQGLPRPAEPGAPPGHFRPGAAARQPGLADPVGHGAQREPIRAQRLVVQLVPAQRGGHRGARPGADRVGRDGELGIGVAHEVGVDARAAL